MNIDVRHGDCLDVLRTMPDNSVDAIATDPPYGLSNMKPERIAQALTEWVRGDDALVPEGRGFMGKAWDGFVPPPAVWKECLRVLKPGGHMAVFAGARTQDLMGLSIRLAGFEIRDTLGWVYGSGFPKSMDIGKAIDKAAGAEREVVGSKIGQPGYHLSGKGEAGPAFGERLQQVTSEQRLAASQITAPATSEAKQWDGWGTALKPAIEPIILARKPLDGTVAANVLAHGVGGLNIDACRVSGEGLKASDYDDTRRTSPKYSGILNGGKEGAYRGGAGEVPAGRFPANVLLDEHAAQEMDKQSGVLKSGAKLPHHVMKNASDVYGTYGPTTGHDIPADSGGASRFFPVFKYQAKAPKKERPVVEREDGTKIQHPTVKPVALMEWLVTLITPPNGTILYPFAGSGTTLQAALNKGFNSIGIEQDADYIKLIEKRLEKEGA